MLRSFRLGEADRVLHVYTADRGRVGAVAKGIRRTKSRFGARLEPLSHVELVLHEGSGELQTVTGVHLRDSHHAAREDSYRLGIGLIGAEAMLRLFPEQERNDRAFTALDTVPRAARRHSEPRAAPAAARPACAVVPAQAALALGLPAAPGELRRVRCRGGARRLPAWRRWSGLPLGCGTRNRGAVAAGPARGSRPRAHAARRLHMTRR